MIDDLTLGTLIVSGKDKTYPTRVEFLVHGVEGIEHSELLDIDEVKELLTFLKDWCNEVEMPAILKGRKEDE